MGTHEPIGGAQLIGRAAASFALLAMGLGFAVPGLVRFLPTGSPYGDDLSSHLAEILHIARTLRAGRSDFWFDGANLGYPLFVAYHPLPSLVLGVVSAVVGTFISPILLLKLSIVVSWSLAPAAWYRGARLFGLRRLPSLLFAMFVVSVADFRDFGLGFGSVARKGLFTQCFGMLVFPLAMGSLWRHVVHGRGRSLGPATLFALTVLSHVFFGLLTLIAAALMLIVPGRGAVGRFGRLARVGLLASVFTSWWLIPFLANLGFQGGLPWKNASENGYSTTELALRLSRGELFDFGRAPWLTVLVFVGVASAVTRPRDVAERFALGFFFVCATLLLGPTTFGPWYRRLPLHGELEVVRYLSGVQLSGSLLAALALARGVEWIRSSSTVARPDRLRVMVLSGCVVSSIVMSRTVASTLRVFDYRAEPFDTLVRLAAAGSGRMMAHKKLGTAPHFYMNLLPALANRPQLQSFGRGYHDNLSVYYLERFDFSPEAYRLFDVRTTVTRGRTSFDEGLFGEPVSLDGELRIFSQRGEYGYFEFVRSAGSISGDPKAIRPLVWTVMLPLYARGWVLDLSDDDPDRLVCRSLGRSDVWVAGRLVEENVDPGRAASFLRGGRAAPPIESVVSSEKTEINSYSASVIARGVGERLLLKVTHHAYWNATIDGETVEILPVTPTLMSLTVPTGAHEVRFEYKNPAYQKLLLFAAGVVFIVLWRCPHRCCIRGERNGGWVA
ncbi:MAG: hypothetical protein HYV07_23075 [Deltaproteobacteria bacterium]|nr:hypothetical protein [Deltaproteobacteria bacterium]